MEENHHFEEAPMEKVEKIDLMTDTFPREYEHLREVIEG